MLILVACSDAEIATELKWHTDLPQLPAATGQTVQHGLAGAYSGVLNDANGNEVLVMAGGANFSRQPLIDAFRSGVAPQKIYQRDIFLMTYHDSSQGTQQGLQQYQWQQSDLSLPLGGAYGASFTTELGVLMLGGEKQGEDGSVYASNEIELLTLKDGKLSLTTVGEMPGTFTKGASVMSEGKIYLIGGKQDGKATNAVQVYDVAAKTWSQLNPYPATARVSPVASILDNTLYIFSGSSVVNGENILLTDGYKIKLSGQHKWQAMADVLTDDAPIALLGAATIKLNDHQSLFVGGYNKQVFDTWLSTIKRVAGTQDEQPAKVAFFSQTPQQFNWNKQALLFDARTQQWEDLGETPFLPNCGASIENFGGNIMLLNGEIMPGVRTATVKIAVLE